MKTRRQRIFIAVMLITVILSIREVSAQSIELTPFAGWQLHGTAKLYDGDFRINDAANFGGKLAVALASTTLVEFSYMRSDTEGRFYPFIGTIGDLVALSSNYVQLGGVQEVDLGRIKPFGTITAGLTVWSPKSSQYNSKTQFSATVGGGLKIWLTDFLGIRLQGSMLMPMVWNGVGFGCGIGTGGSGCGGNVYTRITPFQGEFSGGLILRISPN